MPGYSRGSGATPSAVVTGIYSRDRRSGRRYRSARSAFHDLRHTGNTLAAQTYVSTKNLMARMGQDSPRAALIYQHASRHVDQTIAVKLSTLIEGIGT
jgi:integrase